MSSADGVSREVAWRVFADEYDDATLAFKQGDDERAPNYVVTPTGAKVNRLFVVGVLTETENVGNDGDMYRARISDPTGAFVAYAGQYQQEAMSFFADADPPMFVAIVGKARTYEPDDGDRIYTSIRPEAVNGVDGATRDRWNVQTARQTLARIDAVASYFRGTAESDGANALLARLHDLDATATHYDLDAAYLTDLRGQCLDVLADLAGEDVDDDAARVDLDVEPPADGPTPGETRSGETTADGSATTDRPSTDGTAADEGAGDGDAPADDGDEAVTGDVGESGTDDGGFDPDDFGDVDQEPVDAADGDVTEEPGADDAATTADRSTEAATEPEETTDPATAGDGPTDATETTAEPDGPTDAGTDEPDAAGGTGAASDAGGGGEEEWEWDEGERERLEDEFGAEFESASDFDPDEATVGGEAPAEADSAADAAEADEADQGAGEAPGADVASGETDGGDDGTPGSAEEPGAAGAEEDDADDEAEDEEDAATDAADAETAGAAEDPQDVVMAVLEDAEPEGLSPDEVVEAAADRGLGEDAAQEALDDLLMEGLCYESGDVVKPL